MSGDTSQRPLTRSDRASSLGNEHDHPLGIRTDGQFRQIVRCKILGWGDGHSLRQRRIHMSLDIRFPPTRQTLVSRLEE